MSTLAVVEQVLRAARTPLTARQIVQRAGRRLPSTAKRLDNVVGRDLAVNIRKLGNKSVFARVAPGLFTLRVLAGDRVYESEPQQRPRWTWSPEQLRARAIRQRAAASSTP